MEKIQFENILDKLKRAKWAIFAVVIIIIGYLAWLFLAPKPTEIKPPLRLVELVSASAEQKRAVICGRMKDGLFLEVCSEKFASVTVNDDQKLSELLSLFRIIVDDTTLSEYDRSLLATVVFAALPNKNSPISLRFNWSNLLARAQAQELGNLGMGQEQFNALMESDLKAIFQNMPKGDNAWTVVVSVSKYEWVNGERQPIYSDEYFEHYNPFPGNSMEPTDQSKITFHVQSRIGQRSTSQAIYQGPFKGTGEMVSYSFTFESWQSQPYGSDSVLVLAEAGPDPTYLTSKHDFTQDGYQGKNLLTDLLAKVPLPTRKTQQEIINDRQVKDSSAGDKQEVSKPGSPISKNNYEGILGSSNCQYWAMLPETGIWCFKDGELAAGATEGNLTWFRNFPPTYSFYDGNEPWQAPLETKTEESDEEPPQEEVIPERAGYQGENSNSSGGGGFTIPR